MFKTFDGVKSATQLSTIPKCGGGEKVVVTEKL